MYIVETELICIITEFFSVFIYWDFFCVVFAICQLSDWLWKVFPHLWKMY